MTHVLLADDDAAIRTVVGRALTRAGCQVEAAASAQGLMRLVSSGRGDVLVTDVMLPDGDGLALLPRIRAARPDLPVIVISAQSTLATAVRAEQGGAFDYLPKPFDLDALVRAVSAAAGRSRAVTEPVDRSARAGDGLPMVGRSPAMQDVFRLIARLASTTLPVLVTGESGTGKELVARALHDLGPRAQRPFVAVNMAAIPRELIESELFGHERGAFTGATTARAGRFEQAQGGTLFLDEIGDMPLEAQTRLLRVLQSGEFTSVGGADARRADVRVVSATNKDLPALVTAERFREDLYYRLNVVPIHLPPLRDRKEDIPELARLFLERAPAHGLPVRRLSPGAEARLVRHDWPGNVRELENLIRR
ncbi:MAG: sigma 54-interacting transcriptional regulator, partial [Sphingomonadaceae bacterium]